ncbi:MAG TPA: hypothetical protein VF484_07630, partial [Candidatus Limnocylindrales bacterium]
MTDRHLTDAQIASALRAHLPQTAPAGTRRALLGAVAVTEQQRPMLPVVGWLSNAGQDRRGGLALLLVVGLVALLAGLAAAGAWQAIQPRRVLAPQGGAGGWIAYDTPRRGFLSQIHLVRMGQPERAFITDPVNGATCPAFSPDGSLLAYAIGDEIVVSRFASDGSLGAEVARYPLKFTPHRCPVWSPLGDALAVFASTNRIEILRPGGSGTSLAIGDATMLDAPGIQLVWSPRADRIAAATDRGILIVPLDGGASTLLPDSTV